MILYRILLPKDQTMLAEWKKFVLDKVGGFTQYNAAQGLWLSPAGETIGDTVVPFEIACGTETQWRRILAKAFELFPNEQAIFWAAIGQATIEYRAMGMVAQGPHA